MSLQLTPERMAAFSDGVIAVIITVMVLDLRVPAHDLPDREALRKVLPTLTIYALWKSAFIGSIITTWLTG
jgi:uncharacterized membrane protein